MHRELVQHRCRILAAVTEGDALEAHLAARDFEHARARPIDARVRHGDGLHAFLHHADVFEDAGHLPAHPAGDIRDLPGERERRGDDAGAELAVRPEPDADGRGTHQEQRVHHREREVELGDEPHVPAHRLLVLVDRLAHIGVLVGEAGK